MKNDKLTPILFSLVLIATGLILLLCCCEAYEMPEAPTPPPPVSELAGYGHCNDYVLFWHDFDTGWKDTLYAGREWYTADADIPDMEWGELRIESTDSVYLRLRCVRVKSIKAASIKIKTGG